MPHASVRRHTHNPNMVVLHQQQNHGKGKLSPRSGPYDLGRLENTSWTYCCHTLLEHLLALTTTHFSSLISKSMHTSENSQQIAQPHVYLHAALNSSWTLDLCGLQLRNTNDSTTQQIESSTHTMVSVHTSPLLTVHHCTYGASSLKIKNCQSTFFTLSCQNLVMVTAV